MSTTYTDTEIKSAIARSISHDEIVTVECDDTAAALERIDNDENITELGHAEIPANNYGEHAAYLDVWGKRLGEDFRLYLKHS